jgi:hypothetical protein
VVSALVWVVIPELLNSNFGTGLIGVLGVLLGVLVERVARLSGRLRFEGSVLSRTLMTSDTTKEHYGKEVSWDDVTEATEAEADSAKYTVIIDLFNGKEVPVGLRAVRLELTRNDGPPIKGNLFDIGPPVRGDVEVINLRPREVRHMQVQGSFGKGVVEAVSDRRWRSIDFVAEFPARPFLGILGSTTYRKTIAKP